MSIKVSAIVASYNHAEYLDQRMTSLLNQTYGNLEIIVIDDKSTDESRNVLDKYKNYPNVQLVYKDKNSGWVDVSNNGAQIANGELIIFANCDDYCEPTQIEKLVYSFKNDPDIILAYSKSTMVDERSIAFGDDFQYRTAEFKKEFSNGGLIKKNVMEKFLLHSCVIPNLSGALIKKDVFLEIGGFSKQFKVVSDWELFFKLCEKGPFYYLSEPLNNFRQHGTTIRQSEKISRIINEYVTLLFFWFKRISLSRQEKNQFKKNLVQICFAEMKAISPLKYYRNFFASCIFILRKEPVFVPFFLISFFQLNLEAIYKKVNISKNK